MDEKNVFLLSKVVYSTHKNCTTRLVQVGMSSTRKHKLLHRNRLSLFFLPIHCLAALDLGSGVEQPNDYYLLIHNPQAVLHGEVDGLEDNNR